MEKYIENVPDSSQAKYYKIIHECTYNNRVNICVMRT